MKRNKFLRTSLWITVVFALVAIFFSDCKKYPDGPRLSFRSKATRISTMWYIESYLLNGSDQTTTYFSYVGEGYALSISKDGTYLEYGNFPDQGTCQFGDKHENFYRQSYSNGGQIEKYIILRLEFKSMWLKHIKVNGDVEEIHFIAYR